MATFKFNGISALTLSEKITTPSIRLQKDGNNWYVPLFSGNAGQQVVNGSYKYTLGHLKVGDFRAAISRAKNTYTNTVVVEFYTTTQKDIDRDYSSHEYGVTDKRIYYLRVSSASMEVGSVTKLYPSGLVINNVVYDYKGGTTTINNPSLNVWYEGAIQTCWYTVYKYSSSYPSNRYASIQNLNINIEVNGVTLSQTPTWSDTVQSITFTQTGTL